MKILSRTIQVLTQADSLCEYLERKGGGGLAGSMATKRWIERVKATETTLYSDKRYSKSPTIHEGKSSFSRRDINIVLVSPLASAARITGLHIASTKFRTKFTETSFFAYYCLRLFVILPWLLHFFVIRETTLLEIIVFWNFGTRFFKIFQNVWNL